METMVENDRIAAGTERNEVSCKQAGSFPKLLNKFTFFCWDLTVEVVKLYLLSEKNLLLLMFHRLKLTNPAIIHPLCYSKQLTN
jgi:hypothetical protein